MARRLIAPHQERELLKEIKDFQSAVHETKRALVALDGLEGEALTQQLRTVNELRGKEQDLARDLASLLAAILLKGQWYMLPEHLAAQLQERVA